jgi:cyanophycin synthetase
MEALERFLEKFPNKIKTGVIGGTGDRRNEDLLLYGRIAARMFTSVIVREDEDLRGRARGETNRFVIEGIRQANPEMPIKEILSPPEAIEYALHHARKGELLVILADKVQRTIDIVEKFREQAKPFTVEPEDVIHQTEA